MDRIEREIRKRQAEELMSMCEEKSKTSILLGMRQVFQEIMEINVYEDSVLIWNTASQWNSPGEMKRYSSFLLDYVDEMIYPYEHEEFTRTFHIENVRKFLQGEIRCVTMSVRLRRDAHEQKWYQARLMRNPIDPYRAVLLLDENASHYSKLEKAIASDYDFVLGIILDSGIFSVYKSNEKVAHFLNFSSIDYEGQAIIKTYEYVVPDRIDQTIEAVSLNTVLQKLEEREEYCYYTTVVYRKKKFHKKLRFLYLDEEKKVVLMSMMDVTEQIEKQRQKNYAVRYAFEEVTRANVAKSEFLSRMSHDIRTPLNAILGMSMVAATHIHDEEQVMDSLNQITIAGRHLLTLVNEVLDMSRIESGRMALDEREFSLKTQISQTISVLQPLVREHQHDLSIDLNDIQSDKVVGDSDRLNQIVTNLLGNSIKYTPAGGKLYLKVCEITEEDMKLPCFRMIVRDNGIGMSEEFLEHIYEPFTREEDTRINKIVGTGLGMSITQNLVHMMNGTINIRSRKDEGTEVQVTFSLKPVQRWKGERRKRKQQKIEIFQPL